MSLAQAPAIGLMSRVVLEEERSDRHARKEGKARQVAEKERMAAEKAELGRLPPSQLFRREEGKYSKFDARVSSVLGRA